MLELPIDPAFKDWSRSLLSSICRILVLFPSLTLNLNFFVVFPLDCRCSRWKVSFILKFCFSANSEKSVIGNCWTDKKRVYFGIFAVVLQSSSRLYILGLLKASPQCKFLLDRLVRWFLWLSSWLDLRRGFLDVSFFKFKSWLLTDPMSK